MASFRAIIKAHGRAEQRIIYFLRRVWKKRREQVIKDVESGNLSRIDMQEWTKALKRGFITAYVYGKIVGINRTYKKKFQDLIKVNAGIREIIGFILTKDKGLIKTLLKRRGYKISGAELLSILEVSPATMDFLEQYTLSLSQVEEQATLNKVKDLLRDATEQGMGQEEMANYMRLGLKEFSENRIKAIARTETTRMFNIGRLEETYQSNVVVGWRFNATMDQHTSDICTARNGMFIPKGREDLLVDNTPPLHVNCRSQLEEVLEDEKIQGNVMQRPELLPAPQTRSYDKQVLQRLLNAWK